MLQFCSVMLQLNFTICLINNYLSCNKTDNNYLQFLYQKVYCRSSEILFRSLYSCEFSESHIITNNWVALKYITTIIIHTMIM